MRVVDFLPEAGTRPGGRGTFLPRGKKVPKETRPAVCDPHAARGGTPGARRWRGALRNSLRATRFAQTTAASQTTKHARLRACHPTTASPQAQPERGWRPTRAIAALGLARAARSACVLGAERSDGPCGASNPFWPYRGAQGVGRARVPKDTRASLSDLPRLFERSAAGAQ